MPRFEEWFSWLVITVLIAGWILVLAGMGQAMWMAVTDA